MYIDCPGCSQELWGGYQYAREDRALGAPGAEPGFTDERYQADGARLGGMAEATCGAAGLTCDVKEPLFDAFGVPGELYRPG